MALSPHEIGDHPYEGDIGNLLLGGLLYSAHFFTEWNVRLVGELGGDVGLGELIVSEGAVSGVVEFLFTIVVHAVEADFYFLFVFYLRKDHCVHGDAGVEVDQFEGRPVQLALQLAVDVLPDGEGVGLFGEVGLDGDVQSVPERDGLSSDDVDDRRSELLIFFGPFQVFSGEELINYFQVHVPVEDVDEDGSGDFPSEVVERELFDVLDFEADVAGEEVDGLDDFTFIPFFGHVLN